MKSLHNCWWNPCLDNLLSLIYIIWIYLSKKKKFDIFDNQLKCDVRVQCSWDLLDSFHGCLIHVSSIHQIEIWNVANIFRKERKIANCLNFLFASLWNLPLNGIVCCILNYMSTKKISVLWFLLCHLLKNKYNDLYLLLLLTGSKISVLLFSVCIWAFSYEWHGQMYFGQLFVLVLC